MVWILIVVTVVIALLNYQPGTFLSGWDTLHPELDFELNFSRLIQGVWRPEQGLGALAGHSHMADLPRVLILWILHFFLPLSSLRYIYVFTCLLLGAMGMYYLLRYLLLGKRYHATAACVGSLYYLLNLVTIQHFHVPFEMFTTQYAFLPWIMLFSFRFLNRNRKRDLWLFALTTLLGTPQAYAAHLWYAFFGVYLLSMGIYVWWEKIERRRLFLLIILTLTINSFWLLPNLYFVGTSGHIPAQSKQNRIYSQELLLKNRAYGYPLDVAVGKGVFLSWNVYDFQEKKVVNLMKSWNDHLNTPLSIVSGLAICSMVLAGVYTAWKKRNSQMLAILPFLTVPFVLLLNHTPPFEWLFNWFIRDPFWDEVLRFVFTKFSIPLVFSYSLYLGYCVCSFAQAVPKKGAFLISVIVSLAILFISFPVFQGKLISPYLRVQIPPEYFQFWNFMKNQDQGTVLALPVHSFSGWQYYSWGYQGSGFIWFGLKQPVLDRDFDRWNAINEQAFREFQYSLYGQDPDSFLTTLQKYNIRYVFWDRSVTMQQHPNQENILFHRQTRSLLHQLEADGHISLLRTFGKNLEVYKITKKQPEVQEMTIQANVLPQYQWGYTDLAYQALGNYITDEHQSLIATYKYPYRKLLNLTDRVPPEVVKNGNLLKERIVKFEPSELWLANSKISGVQLRSDGTKAEHLNFRAFNETNNLYLHLPELSHTEGYILAIEATQRTGLPLRVCLQDYTTYLCRVYDELSRFRQYGTDYFLVPPIGQNRGFLLTLSNISLGGYESVNDLRGVAVYRVPSDFFTQVTGGSAVRIKDLQTVVLQTSYHQGWLAFRLGCQKKGQFSCSLTKAFPYLFGERLDSHILVNNWANGWIIRDIELNGDGGTDIRFVFWPQYLQYAGYSLLVGSLVYLLFAGKRQYSRTL